MGKVLKAGRIVVMLTGKYAGKKAVILRSFEEGNGDHRFSHCVVAGIAQHPRKVTRAHQKADAKKGTNKVEKRRQMRAFLKVVNYRHVMPTRYTLDIHEQIKTLVGDDTLIDASKKATASRKINQAFETRFKNPQEGKSDKAIAGAAYFFQRLRF